jgi:hypothetical protein
MARPTLGAGGDFEPRRRARGRATRLFAVLCAIATLVAVLGPRGGDPARPRRHVVVDASGSADGGARSLGESPEAARARITGGGPGASDAVGSGKPLVAVYFTGQARTLNRTLCSIRRRIFDPLLAQGFAPVVFVAGEADEQAAHYERFLGNIRGVELGAVLLLPRPEPEDAREEGVVSAPAVPRDALPSPAADPRLPTPLPHRCVADFKRAGRWFHSGGSGTTAGSKNERYSAEVLSQLYYRAVVDRLRERWERERAAKDGGGGPSGVSSSSSSSVFSWIVSPRPDNVYVSDLPDLRALDPREHAGTVWTPTWGSGSNPRAFGFWFFGGGSGSGSSRKRAEGVNNRFSYGGVRGMAAYHDAYVALCHDGLSSELPRGVNLEQLVAWYRDRPATRERGWSREAKIPGEFWFARLRLGGSAPVESPAHRPAMVEAAGPWWDERGRQNKRGGMSSARELERKRWEVWALAASEAWACEGAEAARAGACALASARRAWDATATLRRVFWFSRDVREMAFPGGWMHEGVRGACDEG